MLQEILGTVLLAGIAALVPFILVLVVNYVFKLLDRLGLNRLRGIAEDLVLWAEEKVSSGKKFDAAVARLVKMTGIPKEQAEVLIQASFEKLRQFIHEGRGKNG